MVSLFDHELMMMLLGSRLVARALTARAMLRLHNGEVDEAWQDLLACHRFTRLMGYFGLDYICSMARGNEKAMVDFFRGDDWAKRLKTVATHPRVDWNEVLRIVNRDQDKTVQAFREPTFAGRQEALAEIGEEDEARAKKVSDLKSLKQAIARNNAPKNLAPKYISAIPKDRFSGEELRYTRHGDGYVLYSVGMNEKDEGGHCWGDSSSDIENDKRDDIAIRTAGS